MGEKETHNLMLWEKKDSGDRKHKPNFEFGGCGGDHNVCCAIHAEGHSNTRNRTYENIITVSFVHLGPNGPMGGIRTPRNVNYEKIITF